MKTKVFITVDTEHSIGGAFKDPRLKPVGNLKRIYGNVSGKAYGIPMIMEIAERYALPLTFFLETLSHFYFGEREVREVCQLILERGHDVQLHLHPNYLNFKLDTLPVRLYSDTMAHYRFAEQRELLANGKDLLNRVGAKNVIAFRAGNFGADLTTLHALKAAGFLIDSSYNQAFIGSSCMLEDMQLNDVCEIEGVLEFPITNFIESTRLRPRRFMPLDLNGVSFREIRYVLNRSAEYALKSITIILHSFSFLETYDLQYENVRPRFNVIGRFDNLCRYLSDNSHRFDVSTFSSLAQQEPGIMLANSNSSFSEVPAMLSIWRAFEQIKEKCLFKLRK